MENPIIPLYEDIILNQKGNKLFNEAMEIKDDNAEKAQSLFIEAKKLYLDAYKLREIRLPSSPKVAYQLYNSANCDLKMFNITKDMDYLKEAEISFKQAIKIMIEKNGEEKNLWHMKGNLGELYGKSGQRESALSLLLGNVNFHYENYGFRDENTMIAIKMFLEVSDDGSELENYLRLIVALSEN
tara:strand:+ start:2037 stop:2591 length:555 start_codon:yes stop_codon:yes gene_type:complete